MSKEKLDVSAPPWNRNPSAWSQRIPICVLAAVAMIISVYLGYFQWGLIDSVWDPFFGEQTIMVIDSDVSHKMYKYIGVPDAILGAYAYLGDAIFGIAGGVRRWQYKPWIVILFGIDVIPLGIVSIILVCIQGLVLGAWCTLCLVTAVISLILIIWAYDEVWSSLKYLNYVRKNHRHYLWNAFWGKDRSLEIEREYMKKEKYLEVA